MLLVSLNLIAYNFVLTLFYYQLIPVYVSHIKFISRTGCLSSYVFFMKFRLVLLPGLSTSVCSLIILNTSTYVYFNGYPAGSHEQHPVLLREPFLNWEGSEAHAIQSFSTPEFIQYSRDCSLRQEERSKLVGRFRSFHGAIEFRSIKLT